MLAKPLPTASFCLDLPSPAEWPHVGERWQPCGSHEFRLGSGRDAALTTGSNRLLRTAHLARTYPVAHGARSYRFAWSVLPFDEPHPLIPHVIKQLEKENRPVNLHI